MKTAICVNQLQDQESEYYVYKLNKPFTINDCEHHLPYTYDLSECGKCECGCDVQTYEHILCERGLSYSGTKPITICWCWRPEWDVTDFDRFYLISVDGHHDGTALYKLGYLIIIERGV